MIPREYLQDEEVLGILIEKRFLIGVPKSEKDLRIQYPEMFDFPEFHRSRLKSADDVLFVYWFACASSPYFDEPEEKKLEPCINMAYKSDARRAQKREEYKNGSFPDEVKAAMNRMMSLNVAARVENYVRLIRIRANCHALLEVDVASADDDAKDAWTKRAPGLWKILEETQKSLERGAYGVTEAQEEMLAGDDGALRDWRNGQR